MNAAGQIAVTLAALVGFGRLFLADEGESHRLSGVLILAGLVASRAVDLRPDAGKRPRAALRAKDPQPVADRP